MRAAGGIGEFQAIGRGCAARRDHRAYPRERLGWRQRGERQQVTHTVGERHLDPEVRAAHVELRAHHELHPAGCRHRAYPHRHELALRLARHGIRERRDQRAHACRRGVLIAPVHRHEQLAGPQLVAELGGKAEPPAPVRDLDQCAVGDAEARGIARMDAHCRRVDVAQQPRGARSAGHRVPLVAHAARDHHEGIICRVLMTRQRGCDRHQARASRGREEAPVAEEAARAGGIGRVHRPLHRRQRVVVRRGNARQRADIEGARPRVLESRERRVLAKDRGRPRVVESVAEAHARGDVAHDPPVVARLAGRAQHAALARDAPL